MPTPASYKRVVERSGKRRSMASVLNAGKLKFWAKEKGKKRF
jgi:hypothetical protein